MDRERKCSKCGITKKKFERKYPEQKIRWRSNPHDRSEWYVYFIKKKNNLRKGGVIDVEQKLWDWVNQSK